MKALIYARVSTDEQASSGAGLAAQEDACRACADRHGWPVGGGFRDEGISGAAPLDKRPGLLDALAGLGPGDVLLVAKRDRLGRDVVGVALIESAVNRTGARVVSAAGEGTADDDPASVLMRRIIDAFAEHERLLIRFRTRAALRAKARRGERVGKVPRGRRLADDGRTLVDHPGERAALADARRWRADGMSLRRIGRALHERGFVSPRGGPLGPSTIRHLLNRTDPE